VSVVAIKRVDSSCLLSHDLLQLLLSINSQVAAVSLTLLWIYSMQTYK